MCGIMGFVKTGEATKYTWPVVQNTFKGLQKRGKDASGWSVLRHGRTVAMKRPVPSSKMASYKKFENYFKGGDLMIGHSRLATHGEPTDNGNNHPFWTSDGRYVMVHNGIIFDNPENLHIESECDSEIALRMIERHGVIGAFEKMAWWYMSRYAIIVLDTKEKKLYASRNEDQPLAFVNLRHEIGGYLIGSTDQILRDAMKKAGVKEGNNSKILETYPYSVYEFTPGESEIEPIRLDAYYNRPRMEELFPRMYGGNYYGKGKTTQVYATNNALPKDRRVQQPNWSEYWYDDPFDDWMDNPYDPERIRRAYANEVERREDDKVKVGVATQGSKKKRKKSKKVSKNN